MKISISQDADRLTTYLASRKDPIICDIETTSLTIGKGRILCIGFAPLRSKQVIVWIPKTDADIAKLRLSRGVFHNAHFDLRWLRHYGATVDCTWDTMLMAHLLDENAKVGLKNLGMRLLGYSDWTLGEISRLTRVNDALCQYVAKDVYVTRELMRYQQRQLKRHQPPGGNAEWVMTNIMIPAIRPLTQMEDNRLPIRMDRLGVVSAEITEQLQAIDHTLDASIPPREQWPDYLQKSTPKWGNTNWTRWWLFDHMGAPIVSRGKSSKYWPEGSPSLSQSALAKLTHPAAKLLRDRSTLHKLHTGFIVPLRDRSVDGRIPTSFRLTGTVTGRLSSASPAPDNPGINAQQIPRDPQIRTLFGDPTDLWIEADYSQLELRVAAVLANEPTMQRLFQEGVDIHTYIAQRLTGEKEVTKTQRTLAKGVNFGFLYGMQSKHFANYLQENYGLIISPTEAEEFRREYFRTFNRLPEWYREQRRFAINHGCVVNAFGRVRHLPKVYSPDFWVQENAFRQAINSPVQSTGSDLMLVSLARLSGDLRLRRFGAKLITTVHDSVCLTAPRKHARKVAQIVKSTMEKADDLCETKFQLKADVTVSRFWGGDPLATY